MTYLEVKSKAWKETNFQVMSAYFNIIAATCGKSEVYPDRVVYATVPVLVDKLADMKVWLCVRRYVPTLLLSFLDQTIIMHHTFCILRSNECQPCRPPRVFDGQGPQVTEGGFSRNSVKK